MQTLIYVMLGLPFAFVLLAVSGRVSNNMLHILNRIVATAVGIFFLELLIMMSPGEVFDSEYLYLDALSVWVLLIVTILYVASAWVSKSYLIREHKRGYLCRTPKLIGRYYALFNLFVWTMMLVLMLKNLGLMWVGIEATTLVSALLVSFKFTRSALEATWKYIMVCTVGICLALLGTMILYYAQLTATGTEKALSWLWLSQHADLLNPSMTKLAFLFIFIGYGTKIGLVPMHTWLPDVYSEAPSLISGLLSGALCTCAIYVLIRNLIIVMPTVGTAFIMNLFLVFAFLTVSVAVPFVLVQRDIKRLLAYSSMENIGIMVVGLGLFSSVSVGATLLHMFNHALIKFVLFYIAGTVIQEFQTKNMMRIHGMVQEAPNTATFLLMGMFAILGMPPFGLFFSKFNIIFSLFKNGQYLLGSLLVLLLAGILIGILYHVMRMLSGKAKRKADADLLDHTDTPFLAALLIGSIVLGMGLDRIPYLSSLLIEASQIVVGGGQL
ncbi:MAG: hydrogenase 4 subunit F [Negativicutes bacterium]|nr:hydrogenase 4 subunit F [Negativicutes bacterium]